MDTFDYSEVAWSGPICIKRDPSRLVAWLVDILNAIKGVLEGLSVDCVGVECSACAPGSFACQPTEYGRGPPGT